MSFLKKLFSGWKGPSKGRAETAAKNTAQGAEKNRPSVEKDVLLQQLKAAMADYASLWRNPDQAVSQLKIIQFRNRWGGLYQDAKVKTNSFFFRHGFGNKALLEEAAKFFYAYDSLATRLDQHNQGVRERRAEAAGKLILPVEGKNLDRQQLACIATEAHSHLVLAGAGTGKTTTIVGYVKYLLAAGKCRPEDILVLSYTNASAGEMSQRLANETQKTLAASTFHKLGLNIITAVEGRKPSICKESELSQFVRRELKELMIKEDYLRKLYNYLPYVNTRQKSAFDFSSEKEYKDYLDKYPPTTLKREKVKSYGEMDIANFLYQNGVDYIYEDPYFIDTSTADYGQYHPDFHLPDYNIYIEYFGINKQGKVPAYFRSKNGEDPSTTYWEGIKWKRDLHKKHHTVLIEAFAYEKFDENLLEKLAKHLQEQGVRLKLRPPDEIWQEVAKGANPILTRLSSLFATVITLVKSNNESIASVRKRTSSPSINLALDLIAPIYEAYERHLAATKQIDFNDMINRATKYVVSGRYQHHYKYVIVDEYQDISDSRYRLLKVLRQQRDYQLFCVGDDWQSIYKFQGSNVGFILDFEKYWGPSALSRIETTYRFSQNLISVSSSFVMKNPGQKAKSLRSGVANVATPVECLQGEDEVIAAELVAECLRKLPSKCTILFLGRYNADGGFLRNTPAFVLREEKGTGKIIEIEFRDRPGQSIEFKTIHSSKGLQADYVIILNNRRDGLGFPSKITDPKILQLLLGDYDLYPDAEERRLFYVALTRARKKVWLLTLKGNESDFVEEVKPPLAQGVGPIKLLCPNCGGRLVKQKGSYGSFYVCSNYKTSSCKYKRPIGKNGRW